MVQVIRSNTHTQQQQSVNIDLILHALSTLKEVEMVAAAAALIHIPRNHEH